VDIQQMRYVLAIARAGGLRPAAVSLFIAPQTLSEQLQRVERSLGGALFERTWSGMTPTALGSVFIEQATQAVTAFDRAAEAVRLAAAGQRPPVRLAWAYGLADVLRELLQKTIAEDPSVHVATVPMGCDEQRASIAASELTAGLVHARAGEFVVASRMVRALLPAGHRLATRDAVSLTELAAELLLLPTQAGPACLHGWEVTQFARFGLDPRLGARIGGIDVAVAAVAAGEGYALCVPVNHPIGDDCRFVPIAEDLPTQDVALIWSDAAPVALTNAAKELAGLLGQVPGS
jgi:DNA-binding transcriptional LysR family regulator